MGDYQRLLTEAEGDNIPLNPLENQRENVYYAKPVVWHKMAFASCIVLCVFFIVLIWGLPCQISPCSSINPDVAWDKTLLGLELKGRMHLVGGNLIAILRGAKWGASNQFHSNGGGVIALLGKTGDEAYWLPLNTLPRYLDCSMLDLSINYIKACLIVGEGGYLAALNPITGITLWNVAANDDHLHDIDVPIVIPDIDNDGSRDLVTLSRYSNGHNKLIFISARSGRIIKQPTLDADCSLVNNLTYDYSSSTLFYTCSNKISSKIESYIVTEAKARNSKWMNGVFIPADERKRFEEGNNAGEHKVIVSNNGTCPYDCFVSINVTDSQNKTVWYYHSDRTYIMYPVSLHFKHSMTGFLLKLWQWHTPIDKKQKKDGMRVELIKERIVLITFNKTGNIMRVVNASQIDIVQLCYENDCQPYLSYQTQSALIADLSGDGSLDLISYLVTYKPSSDVSFGVVDKESVKNWVLESRVKVVRLEAELSTLYEAVSKH